VIALGILWRVVLRHNLPKAALGVFVIPIGLSAFWVAARMNNARLAEQRNTRGPGWWMGWLISKTSVGFARGFYIALGIGICALGLAELLVVQHKAH
jgi:hypothetical protein